MPSTPAGEANSPSSKKQFNSSGGETTILLLSENKTEQVSSKASSQAPTPGQQRRFSGITGWQKRTLVGLIIGYIGFYFCRTNITLAINVILNSLPGIDKAQIGSILSVGYLTYAIGKPVLGIFIDSFGGRKVFLASLCWTILCTVLLTAIPARYSMSAEGDSASLENGPEFLARFGILWSLLRFGQSGGWPSIIQVLSDSFPSNMHGRVLGIASVSYGLGDAMIRVVLGMCLAHLTGGRTGPIAGQSKGEFFIDQQLVWRKLFRISAFCAALAGMICYYLIKRPARSSLSLLNSESNSLRTGKVRKQPRVSSITTLMLLLRMPKFYVLICLAMCLTLLRETILTWCAVFFSEFAGLEYGNAALISLFFPLVGTIGSLFGGFLIDHSASHKRGFVLVVFLMLLAISLMPSMFLTAESKPSIGVVTLLLAIVAFSLMAPFSFVDAVFPLDIIEDNPNTGITLGVLTLCGYMGAMLSGSQVGLLAQMYGWVFVLQCLFAVTILCVGLGCLWWKMDGGERRKKFHDATYIPAFNDDNNNNDDR